MKKNALNTTLTINGTNDYTVSILFRGQSRGVTVRVTHEKIIIGSYNTGKVPVLWAVVAKGNRPQEIAKMQDIMTFATDRAELFKRINERDPDTIAQVARPCDGENVDGYLERAIDRGDYEKSANKFNCWAAECRTELKRLQSAPIEEFERLRVVSWHRSKAMLKQLPPWLRVEDILEIPTGVTANRLSMATGPDVRRIQASSLS